MAAYKDLIGQKITKVTSNPSEPKTGQMWYNSTDGKLRGLGVISAWSSSSALSTARADSAGAGSTDPLTVSTERAANTLVYVDSTQGWLLKNN